MATFDEDGNMYIKLDPSGEQNNSDVAWDDGGGGRVKQILIWHEHNSYVTGIQTVYERKGDKPISLLSKRHGGTKGIFEMITPRKPLTWMTGHYGNYIIDPELILDEDEAPWNYYKVITSLKFGNQEETYGPFGLERCKPFFYRGGTEIVGFHGFSSDATTDSKFGYISAIGLYITTEAVGVVGEPSTRKDCSQNTIESENKPKSIFGK